MAITVSKTGEIWNGAAWISNSDGTAIGLLNFSGGVRFEAMTVFTLTLDKDYRSVTLRFDMKKAGTLAYYGADKPAKWNTEGTALTLAAEGNSVTVTGSFVQGQQVKIYVWGRHTSIYDYTYVVGAATATGIEPIPPATTPVMSAATVPMGGTVTADLSSRISPLFTHSISIRPETSETWTSVAVKSTGTSVSISVPNFAGALPNASAGSLYIKCETYNGNIRMGETQVVIAATVPETAEYFPTATISASEGTLSGYTAFIQGHSSLNVSISASGAAGSTISGISSQFDGKTHSGASWNSGTIIGSGTLTIRTTVTDSRGRSTTVTRTVTVQPYGNPTVSVFEVSRVNQLHSDDDSGDYAKIVYAYAVSCVSYGVSASMRIEYKLRSGSSYSRLTSGTSPSVSRTVFYPTTQMSNNNSFDIRITVTDSLGGETVKVAPLQSAAVIFDVLANGLGFAFGKTAEANLLEIAWKLLVSGNREYALGSVNIRHEIPAYSDLNGILDVGFYCCGANDTAASLGNCPVDVAFVMEVFSGVGGTATGAPSAPAYAYYIQSIITYTGQHWTRYVHFYGSTVATIGDWFSSDQHPTVNIGSAPFNGTSSITLAQMGAAEAVGGKVVSRQASSKIITVSDASYYLTPTWGNDGCFITCTGDCIVRFGSDSEQYDGVEYEVFNQNSAATVQIKAPSGGAIWNCTTKFAMLDNTIYIHGMGLVGLKRIGNSTWLATGDGEDA